MADAIKAMVMPKWGLAMTEGTITAWLKEEGEEIAAGDEILEIETSKITNVHEAPFAGLLRRRVAAVGETLPVGAVLGVLADATVPDAEIDAFVERAREAQAQAVVTAPPEPQFVDAGAVRLRYLRMGPDGFLPVVLIHGFGGDFSNWQFNQPVLAEQRPVIAIDLPGHGGSAKSVPSGAVASLAGAVRAALDAMGIGRAHLAGHSLGGAIALQLAADSPARVASVTLVCSAGLGPDIDMDYIDAFIAADRRREMKAAVEKLFADPALVSRDMVEDLVRYKRLDGVVEALRAIAGASFAGGRQAAQFADRLGALPMPIKAIWGAADRIIPARHAEALPADRRHVLAGAGHMVHIERYDEVNRLIAAFVATADG
jgi:pyruvate dehydrogenase E2 component (dihydrolipoamide acetyltransferase)